VDREAELRRQLRALYVGLASVEGHEFGVEINKAIAGLERELVALLGSERAYRTVEEIRDFVTFGDSHPAARATESERMKELRGAIVRRQEKLTAAINGSADISEPRRLNEELASLIDEMHEQI
jgi:hypothetical protein